MNDKRLEYVKKWAEYICQINAIGFNLNDQEDFKNLVRGIDNLIKLAEKASHNITI